MGSKEIQGSNLCQMKRHHRQHDGTTGVLVKTVTIRIKTIHITIFVVVELVVADFRTRQHSTACHRPGQRCICKNRHFICPNKWRSGGYELNFRHQNRQNGTRFLERRTRQAWNRRFGIGHFQELHLRRLVPDTANPSILKNSPNH